MDWTDLIGPKLSAVSFSAGMDEILAPVRAFQILMASESLGWIVMSSSLRSSEIRPGDEKSINQNEIKWNSENYGTESSDSQIHRHDHADAGFFLSGYCRQNQWRTVPDGILCCDRILFRDTVREKQRRCCGWVKEWQVISWRYLPMQNIQVVKSEYLVEDQELGYGFLGYFQNLDIFFCLVSGSVFRLYAEHGLWLEYFRCCDGFRQGISVFFVCSL